MIIFDVLKCVGNVLRSMFIKKFLGNVKKVLGRNVIERRWYEAPLYKFTIEKEGSEITVEGHGWEWVDGDVVVYKLTDGGWARATVYPFTDDNQAMKAVFGNDDGFENVVQVSGVKDVQDTQIGVTKWDIEVDVAAGAVVDVNRKTTSC